MRMMDDDDFWLNDDPNTERIALPEEAENCGINFERTPVSYENAFVNDAIL